MKKTEEKCQVKSIDLVHLLSNEKDKNPSELFFSLLPLSLSLPLPTSWRVSVALLDSPQNDILSEILQHYLWSSFISISSKVSKSTPNFIFTSSLLCPYDLNLLSFLWVSLLLFYIIFVILSFLVILLINLLYLFLLLSSFFFGLSYPAKFQHNRVSHARDVERGGLSSEWVQEENQYPPKFQEIFRRVINLPLKVEKFMEGIFLYTHVIFSI